MPPSNSLTAKEQEIANNYYYEGGQIHGLNGNARSNASDADTLYNDDPPQRGGEDYVPPKKRIYFADWTRALAVQLVVFIHCLVNAADASGFDPEEEPGVQ